MKKIVLIEDNEEHYSVISQILSSYIIAPTRENFTIIRQLIRNISDNNKREESQSKLDDFFNENSAAIGIILDEKLSDYYNGTDLFIHIRDILRVNKNILFLSSVTRDSLNILNSFIKTHNESNMDNFKVDLISKAITKNKGTKLFEATLKQKVIELFDNNNNGVTIFNDISIKQ